MAKKIAGAYLAILVIAFLAAMVSVNGPWAVLSVIAACAVSVFALVALVVLLDAR